jgi:hypothetical protein
MYLYSNIFFKACKYKLLTKIPIKNPFKKVVSLDIRVGNEDNQGKAEIVPVVPDVCFFSYVNKLLYKKIIRRQRNNY